MQDVADLGESETKKHTVALADCPVGEYLGHLCNSLYTQGRCARIDPGHAFEAVLFTNGFVTEYLDNDGRYLVREISIVNRHDRFGRSPTK